MQALSLKVVLVVSAGILAARPGLADIAVNIAPGALDSIFPAAGTTHGWQFTVNVPIEVTHLGLYDRFQDGFLIDHPIGLWDQQGAILAQDVMSAGAGDLLIDNFRFVDIVDITTGESVVLTPGITYTAGFYSESFNQSDGMVVFHGSHTIHPAINYVGFGVAEFTDGLQMPIDPDADGFHRWGPNLQFTVVPGPAAAWLFAVGLVPVRRRRRP
ncbi:MAG: hypothetical protein ACYSU7_15435 [Planctomycetota bacterium]|jgi:hypothetical protein